jgi:magnesium chelatase family protein
VPHKDLTDPRDAEASAAIRTQVEAARQRQRERLAPFSLYINSRMQARHIRKFCPVDESGQKLLEMVTDKLGLSARTYSRILKVARTIADLAGEEQIRQAHLAEAIQYRGLDRKTIRRACAIFSYSKRKFSLCGFVSQVGVAPSTSPEKYGHNFSDIPIPS